VPARDQLPECLAGFLNGAQHRLQRYRTGWGDRSAAAVTSRALAVTRDQILPAGRTVMVGVETASTDCCARIGAVRKTAQSKINPEIFSQERPMTWTDFLAQL
jgi:hypothetical protein